MSRFGGSDEERKANNPQGKVVAIWAEEVEVIAEKQWVSFAKKIERKNLKEKGASLSFSAIARKANDFIIEVYVEDGSKLVKKGWRNAMRGDK